MDRDSSNSAEQESERRFRFLVEQAGDGFFLHDLDGRILDVNQQAGISLGYSRDELLRLRVSDIEQAMPDAALLALWRGMRANEANLIDGVHRRKDGSTFPVEIRNRRIEADGRSLVLALARDVSDRKRAEEALRQSENRFRLLVEEAADAFFLVDMDEEPGRFLDVNEQACQSLGYTRAELLGGMRVRDIEQEWSEQRLRETWASMLPEVPYTWQGVHRRKDGSRFPVEVRSRCFHGDGHSRLLTLARDVSERSRIQNELQRAETSFRLLLESSGEGIFGVDRDMRCTFVNRAAARMLLYEPEEMRGRNMHTLIHYSQKTGEPHPRSSCFVYRSVRQGHSFTAHDEVFWRKDGKAVVVDYSANPTHENGRITGAVVVFHQVEEDPLAVASGRFATHDGLTGLVNRQEFERRLQAALQSSQQRSTSQVLCLLNLDQFKVVNDTLGPTAGDELLRQVARILQDSVRNQDQVARLGGDEFGVLLADCTLEQAMRTVDAMREAIGKFRFTWDDRPLSVTASAGLVAITDDIPGVAALLAAANAASYVAKEAGRDRVHVYSPTDALLARRRSEMQWVSRLQEALAHDRFRLYYQPIVAAGHLGERRQRFEVLVRMVDERGHLILPGEFIPAAQRYNLIGAVDRWVVGRVLEWFERHRNLLPKVRLCTINISASSIGDEQFVRFVIDRLRVSRVPPGKICFEITETAAIANLDKAIEFMNRLKSVGCRFALDDFGSGMASFAYLKRLPIDLLKIDGSFVLELHRDPVNAAMVQAMNQIGHLIGLHTVAEFVESGEILEKVLGLGVDYVQGYAISVPRSVEELARPVLTASDGS